MTAARWGRAAAACGASERRYDSRSSSLAIASTGTMTAKRPIIIAPAPVRL